MRLNKNSFWQEQLIKSYMLRYGPIAGKRRALEEIKRTGELNFNSWRVRYKKKPVSVNGVKLT